MNPPGGHHSRLLRKPSPPSDGASTAPSVDAIRVMLIDDSLTVRTVLKRMVESDPGMVVADTASSAERGIAQLKNAAVDVILLDLEMPGMGGLVALPDILAAAPDAQVMVVSSLTEDGAQATVEALSQGAADTMLKPRPGGFNEEYRSQLLGKIRALGTSVPDAVSTEANATTAASTIGIRTSQRRSKRPEVLAIGASTGGIHAMNVMLRALTPSFDLPILITQHLPASFIPVFARQIEVASGRPTRIAEEGAEILQGEIMIASGEGHMTVRRAGDRVYTRVVSERPPAAACRQSIPCWPASPPPMTGARSQSSFPGWAAMACKGRRCWSKQEAQSGRRTRKPAPSGECPVQSRRPG